MNHSVPAPPRLFRLLSGIGVACDVIAPSLVPVRAGDRVKTDRREAVSPRALLRHGHIYREGKRAWTRQRREWVDRQRLQPLREEAAAA